MKAITMLEIGLVLLSVGVFIAPRLLDFWFLNLLFEIPGGVLIVVGLIRLGREVKMKKERGCRARRENA